MLYEVITIVGNKFFKNKELFSVYQSLEYKDDIIFTGRLEIETLNKILASATALAFVPYFDRITSYNVCYTKLLRGADQVEAQHAH